MKNINKKREFLTYIKTPLSENSVAVLYSANNIKYDKCNLFSDYIQSLLMILFETYMGDDIMDDESKIKHFNWCWNKNIENFKEEGITFEDTDKSYSYFLEFMIEVFYSVKNKEEKKDIHKVIRKIWLGVFSYYKNKSRSDMDNFIEIYSILDKSLKKGQKNTL